MADFDQASPAPREGVGVASLSSGSQQHLRGRPLTEEEYREFRALIDPLEQRSGRRLYGRGLGACIAAFRDYRPRFREVVREVEEYGRNPVSLLVHSVFEGAHRREPFTDDGSPKKEEVEKKEPRAARRPWTLEVVYFDDSRGVAFEKFPDRDTCEARKVELSADPAVLEVRTIPPPGERP